MVNLRPSHSVDVFLFIIPLWTAMLNAREFPRFRSAMSPRNRRDVKLAEVEARRQREARDAPREYLGFLRKIKTSIDYAEYRIFNGW
jgi:hypothetical protein